MKLTWKWTTANLLLLTIVGCGGAEEPADRRAVAQNSPAPTADTVPSPKLPARPAPEATKSDAKAGDDGPKIEGPKADSDKSPGATSSLTAKELAAIKLLPESEQAAALKQGVCPVSGEPLGAMGKPLQVTFEGRTFYLCCKTCEGDVKADPKAVIAKLDKK